MRLSKWADAEKVILNFSDVDNWSRAQTVLQAEENIGHVKIWGSQMNMMGDSYIDVSPKDLAKKLFM